MANLLWELQRWRTDAQLLAALPEHAAANAELHAILLTQHGLKFLTNRNNVKIIEWLHNYRVAHGVRAAPCEGLLELAVKQPEAMLECFLRLGYISPDLYQADTIPRNLLLEAHSNHIEWIRVRGQFSNAEILSYLPRLLMRTDGDLINIVKWLRSLPHDEMIGEIPKLHDFTEAHITTYIRSRDFAMLDWLVKQGADPNTWNTDVFAYTCNESVAQWYGRHTRIIAHPELLSRQSIEILVQNDNFWCLLTPATNSYWLWALVHYGRIKLEAKRYHQLTTRENCMAHNGRVLRAIVTKKSCVRRWRLLVRRCKLTPSDFASVGLVWPY